MTGVQTCALPILGDRIAVMKDGQVEQFGSPDDIYARPATRFVAEFIGSPAMNFLDARHQDGALVAHGISLALDDAQRAALAAAGTDAVHAGLRPEDVQLADTGLPATVVMVEPTGPETYVTLDCGIGRLVARLPGQAHPPVDARVHLQWAPAKWHLFCPASGRRLA